MTQVYTDISALHCFNADNVTVDGEFTDWTDWGKCDVTCGGGSQLRSRACNGPFHGGQNCSGAWEETQTCNSQNCPGKRLIASQHADTIFQRILFDMVKIKLIWVISIEIAKINTQD